MGVEKMNRKADRWGPAAAAAREAGRRAGVGWLGLLVAARGPLEGEKWRAGPVVWSRGLGRPTREAGL